MREYPKMLYKDFPEHVVANSPEEEARYMAKGYTRLTWSAREAGLSTNPPPAKLAACSICGKRFSSQRGLHLHVERKHKQPSLLTQCENDNDMEEESEQT